MTLTSQETFICGLYKYIAANSALVLNPNEQPHRPHTRLWTDFELYGEGEARFSRQHAGIPASRMVGNSRMYTWNLRDPPGETLEEGIPERKLQRYQGTTTARTQRQTTLMPDMTEQSSSGNVAATLSGRSAVTIYLDDAQLSRGLDFLPPHLKTR